MSAPTQKRSAQEATLAAKDPRLATAGNQIAFRQVNEDIRRLADNADLQELDVFCECEHGHCFTQLSVAMDDYEAVRRFPTRFLVSRNHLGPDARIVEETPRVTSWSRRLGPARRPRSGTTRVSTRPTGEHERESDGDRRPSTHRDGEPAAEPVYYHPEKCRTCDRGGDRHAQARRDDAPRDA